MNKFTLVNFYLGVGASALRNDLPIFSCKKERSGLHGEPISTHVLSTAHFLVHFWDEHEDALTDIPDFLGQVVAPFAEFYMRSGSTDVANLFKTFLTNKSDFPQSVLHRLYPASDVELICTLPDSVAANIAYGASQKLAAIRALDGGVPFRIMARYTNLMEALQEWATALSSFIEDNQQHLSELKGFNIAEVFGSNYIISSDTQVSALIAGALRHSPLRDDVYYSLFLDQ